MFLEVNGVNVAVVIIVIILVLLVIFLRFILPKHLSKKRKENGSECNSCGCGKCH